MNALVGMKLRDVLDELHEGAPVKLGLKSSFYLCGPLPANWESMIEEEHRRDMRYINRELDRLERDIVTFSDKWNKRLNADIEAAKSTEKPKVPGETEADIVRAIRKNADNRLQAWDSLINRIVSCSAELHKPGYLDRPVEAIYDSIDPEEPEGTICILVDGLVSGKYYSSKEYREGTGTAYGRRKTDNAAK